MVWHLMPKKSKKPETGKILLLKDVINDSAFELFLTDENVDTAYSMFENTGIIIHIGTDEGSLCQIISNIQHELMECYLYLKNKRHIDTKLPRSYEAIECIFLFNHTDFQLMVESVTKLLLDIYPNKIGKYLKIVKEKEIKNIKRGK